MEPMNKDIVPHIEYLLKKSLKLRVSLNEVRQTLRSKGVPYMRNKITNFCNSRSMKLTKAIKSIPLRILGDYMGNDLIGIQNLQSFTVLINSQLLSITLRPRKAKAGAFWISHAGAGAVRCIVQVYRHAPATLSE